MLEIEAFDEDTVNELRARARDALLTAAIAQEETVEKESTDLMSVEGMDAGTAAELSAKGIKSAEDLADLAVDELVELTGMAEDRAQALIMSARAPWFA
jgi:N utilization substance protein A